MSRRLYPHRRIKYWHVYDIDNICAVFSDLGLHPQTVRKWITQNGLKTIDQGKPTLIYGHDLIVFLKAQNSKGKCRLDFNQFFCMKCQDGGHLFQSKIVIEQKALILKGHAVCRTCKSRMFRSYSLNDIAELKSTFKLVGVSELYDCTDTTAKTHIEVCSKIPVNESEQPRFL